MAFHRGPKIITDSLIMLYDAANKKSFKGEPTTNLASNPLIITSGYVSSAGIIRTSGTYLNFTGEYNAGTITNTSDSSTGWVARNISGSSGQQYTTSWYLKAGSVSSVTVTWGGGHQGNKSFFTVDLNNGNASSLTLVGGENYSVDLMDNGFYKISYSSTLTTTTYYPQLNMSSIGYVIFGGIQIEQKSYGSPFVDGARGATIATGGGFKDISGNANDGEVFNNPASEPNALSFDGSNDYIQTNLTGTFPQITFEFISFFDDPTLSTTSRNESILGDWNSSRIHFGTRWSVGMHWNVNNSWVNIPNTNIKYGWNHYTLVWDQTNNTKQVFINNILSSTTGTNGNITIGDFKIGVATNLGAYYRGKIALFRVYNKALTTSEIEQNYNTFKPKFDL